MPEYTDIKQMLLGDWIKIHWGIDLFKFNNFFDNFGVLGVPLELLVFGIISVILTILIVILYVFITGLIKTEKLPKEINPDEK
jgi:mannitol-specific phosphotransferase system IIBC component